MSGLKFWCRGGFLDLRESDTGDTEIREREVGRGMTVTDYKLPILIIPSLIWTYREKYTVQLSIGIRNKTELKHLFQRFKEVRLYFVVGQNRKSHWALVKRPCKYLSHHPHNLPYRSGLPTTTTVGLCQNCLRIFFLFLSFCPTLSSIRLIHLVK